MAEPTTANKIGSILFLVGCIITGAILGFWVVNLQQSNPPRPQWQVEEDDEVSYHIENGKIDFYVLNRFIFSLRPDGKNKSMDDHKGNLYSYEDLYIYVSNKLGYECTQLSPYSDSVPMNQIAECHKNNP